MNELHRAANRWLVTGAAGFIGSHIARELLAYGQDVVGLDNLSTGSTDNLDGIEAQARQSSGSFSFVLGDLRNPGICFEALRGVRYVSHQAALGSVPRSLAHPDDTHANNVQATVNLLLAARACGVQGMVCASSSSVYGDHPALPKKEPEIGQPLSPYALSKRVCEEYALTYHRCFDLPVICLRYFNVFGPRQSPNGPYAAVIPRWLAAFCARKRPVIFGDGQTSRDFCPVANVVQANILAATAPATSFGRVYNIALGGQTTLAQLCASLRAQLVECGVRCAHLEPQYKPFRPGDIRHSRASIQLAQELLGYDPKVSFHEGIRRLVEHETREQEPAEVGAA